MFAGLSRSRGLNLPVGESPRPAGHPGDPTADLVVTKTTCGTPGREGFGEGGAWRAAGEVGVDPPIYPIGELSSWDSARIAR